MDNTLAFILMFSCGKGLLILGTFLIYAFCEGYELHLRERSLRHMLREKNLEYERLMQHSHHFRTEISLRLQNLARPHN